MTPYFLALILINVNLFYCEVIDDDGYRPPYTATGFDDNEKFRPPRVGEDFEMAKQVRKLKQSLTQPRICFLNE